MTDPSTQKALDAILEAEIAQGFRVRELPLDLQAQMKAEGITPFTKFRLFKLNPKRRRLLNEAVARSYQRDLQNEEILSNEQVLKLVVKRGEWGADKDERIAELQRRTNAAMSQLYLDGFVQDTTAWAEEILEYATRFRELVEEAKLPAKKKAKVTEVFDRWIAYGPEKADEYTEKYAKPEGRERYSAQRDATFLCDSIEDHEATIVVEKIESLMRKVHEFVKLTEERAELAALQIKHARIFADTVESRRDNTEEMARLYFTSERVDDSGTPCGALMPSFEELWHLPDDVIQFLLVESFFFHNGITDETRPYLEAWGIIRGNGVAGQAEEEENTSSDVEPSAESPAAPSSSPDAMPVAGVL